MKSAIIICFLGMAALALAHPHETTYTDKFDNINLDEILANKKLVGAYCSCMLDKGPCTAEGKELKTHIKEALETDCAKCTPTQRKGSERVLEHCIKNEPECWENLLAKYDPSGKYAKKHEARIKAAKG